MPASLATKASCQAELWCSVRYRFETTEKTAAEMAAVIAMTQSTTARAAPRRRQVREAVVICQQMIDERRTWEESSRCAYGRKSRCKIEGALRKRPRPCGPPQRGNQMGLRR